MWQLSVYLLKCGHDYTCPFILYIPTYLSCISSCPKLVFDLPQAGPFPSPLCPGPSSKLVWGNWLAFLPDVGKLKTDHRRLVNANIRKEIMFFLTQFEPCKKFKFLLSSVSQQEFPEKNSDKRFWGLFLGRTLRPCTRQGILNLPPK